MTTRPNPALEAVNDELEADPSEINDLFGVWTIDPAGDGVVYVRAGRIDATSLAAQLRALLAFIHRNGFRPHSVVASSCSGSPSAAQGRPDLQRLEEALRSDWCKFLATQDLDRISRDVGTLSRLVDLADKEAVDLVTEVTGAKPLTGTRRTTAMISIFAAHHDRARIHHRLQEGIRVRLRAGEHSVFTGSLPFGFTRDSQTREITVDETRWPTVERLFERCCSLEPAPKAELVRKLSKETGGMLSGRQVERVLTRAMYVDGVPRTTYMGETFDLRPVPLERPVSAEQFRKVAKRLR
jgi:DNA invertase Pin-like site-specific DNA recombinase